MVTTVTANRTRQYVWSPRIPCLRWLAYYVRSDYLRLCLYTELLVLLGVGVRYDRLG
jgi:hypothetical protein